MPDGTDLRQGKAHYESTALLLVGLRQMGYGSQNLNASVSIDVDGSCVFGTEKEDTKISD